MPRGREDLLHYAGLAALFVLALAVPFAFGTLSILGSMGVFLLLLSWSISWRRQGGDTLAGVRDRSAWLFWGMAGVIAILIPIIAGTSYFLAVMVTFLIYLSWNVMWGLVLGTAGLQSFATVAVAGISAYVAGYLSVELGKSGNLACVGGGERILGVPVFQWWVAIPVAVLVGLIVGFIISLPAIRLRGIYFALLTIGLVELARALKPHLRADASVVSIGISSQVTASSYGYMSPIKAALESASRFLAKSFSADTRVRFNTVNAGPLKTSASAGIPGYLDNYLHAEKMTFRKEALKTQEVADVAVWLLSPRSSGVNGQGVVVDAGMGWNFFDEALVKASNRLP